MRGDVHLHQSQVDDELRKRLLYVWHDMDQSVTDNGIDEWRDLFEHVYVK